MSLRLFASPLAFLLAASLVLGTLGAAKAQNPATEPAPRLAAFMLELEALPTATVYVSSLRTARDARAATRVAQAQLAAIEAAQQALLIELDALDTPVLYRVQRTYNGVAVLTAASQVAALVSLPHVRAVHRIVPKMPDNATSVPYIGVPTLWELPGTAGLLGRGIRIAVIDTGIDYLHVDFGGPGSGYQTNDVTRIGDVTGFPSVKIAGGHDFVGDTYDADPTSPNYQPVPQPDPDPMDCYTHGTHVAGTIGGYGVTAAGTRFSGPYTRDTAFATLAIGPGVAPLAELYALKVFGCHGSSEIVDQAIEWAVDPNGDGDFADRMDVINLSVGSPYGARDDTTAVAADRASAVGVVVVASAGNSGDNYLTVGAPSVADRVISVAAIQHQSRSLQSATPWGDAVASFSARGPRRTDAGLKPDLAAPGVNIKSAAAGSGAAGSWKSGTSMAAPHVAGAAALLRELHPNWTVEELKALLMNTATPLAYGGNALTSPLFSPPRIGAGRIDLGQAVATTVVAMNADQPGQVSVSFGAPRVQGSYTAVRNVQIVNRGAASATFVPSYIPTTDMPGVTIDAPTGPLTAPPDGRTFFPVTLHADVAQMRRERDATVATVQSGPRNWLSEESGHLLLWPTPTQLTAPLIMPGAPDADAGIAQFRYTPATRTLAYTITAPLALPSGMKTVNLGRGQPGAGGAVRYLLYSGPLTPGVDSPISGEVELVQSDELWLAGSGLYVELLPEIETTAVRGQIVAAPSVLHLPVYAAPQAAAAMHSTTAQVDFGDQPATPANLTLTGQSLSGTAYPTDVLALGAVFDLQLRSPNTRPPGLAPHEDDRYDHADLSYVGVASNGVTSRARADQVPTLFFALAVHAPWSTPNEVELNVLIDVNRDGSADYRLFNSNTMGYQNPDSSNDVFVSVLEHLPSSTRQVAGPLNGVAPDAYDSAPFFSQVMVLPVQLADLAGIDTGRGFAYWVETYSNDLYGRVENLVERTPMLHYIPQQPALYLQLGQPDAPRFADLPGANISVQLNVAGYAGTVPPEIMLVHHHNPPASQVEVAGVHYAWPRTVHLPLVTR